MYVVLSLNVFIFCRVGSWTFDGSKLNMTSMSDQADVSTYQPNPAYDLLSAEAKRHVMLYECCPEPYIDITYYLTFKKN